MIRTCDACGQKNRVPAHHLHQRGRCGACKADLAALGQPVDADPALLEDVVQNARVPVLIDFWAAWCGPCRAAAPEVAKAASELKGRGIVLKVDTDAHPSVAARFGVTGIPQFTVTSGGRTIDSSAGLVRAGELVARVLRAA